MPRSPTLNLAMYPSIPRRVSSASITNPSAATRLSFIPLDRNVRPPSMVQLSFLTLSYETCVCHASDNYLQLIYMRYPGWPNFHVRRAEIRAQIRIVTPDIRIRPKRNRGVKAAEILFVTKLKRINDRVIHKSKAAALAISRRGAATSIVEGAVMLARGRVGDDYTTGYLRMALPRRRARHVITRLQVAFSTKSDPSPPPRAAQARSACGESTDVAVVNGEPRKKEERVNCARSLTKKNKLYGMRDRLYRYFAPPNALLPEGSLRRHEHVEPHLFVVLDKVLVHDLRFCHKARNQKYQHYYTFLNLFCYFFHIVYTSNLVFI
ncbi:hypothetical protein ALC62_10715 [Cyphomyrmex costatus]|uniref:Uncharacterized protein n=1 Tax=Cyphomyrmex costatus TaxID=456900 RepID=A0A195CD66_9HYME|nr:hypothetical protein ALC62_10715 [Cyphomyrmex costatus]